jgi:hypothetical protein
MRDDVEARPVCGSLRQGAVGGFPLRRRAAFDSTKHRCGPLPSCPCLMASTVTYVLLMLATRGVRLPSKSRSDCGDISLLQISVRPRLSDPPRFWLTVTSRSCPWQPWAYRRGAAAQGLDLTTAPFGKELWTAFLCTVARPSTRSSIGTPTSILPCASSVTHVVLVSARG